MLKKNEPRGALNSTSDLDLEMSEQEVSRGQPGKIELWQLQIKSRV